MTVHGLNIRGMSLNRVTVHDHVIVSIVFITDSENGVKFTFIISSFTISVYFTLNDSVYGYFVNVVHIVAYLRYYFIW